MKYDVLKFRHDHRKKKAEFMPENTRISTLVNMSLESSSKLSYARRIYSVGSTWLACTMQAWAVTHARQLHCVRLPL